MTVTWRNAVMLLYVVVIPFVLTRIAHAAEWSDRTLIVVALGTLPPLILIDFLYELRRTPRIERRR